MKLFFDVAQLENLSSLHAHEEELRSKSLKILAANQTHSELMFMVANAMGVLFGFTHDHKAQTDDELTIQYFGIRLFNSAGCSIKLALSGYPQQALGHIRDIIEIGFLLDYFHTSKEQIAAWRVSDGKTRATKFAPKHIRAALDARDGNKERKRGKVYGMLSEYASHATYSGFRMTMKDGEGQLGPFVDETKLKAWMQEIALRLLPAAAIYGAHFKDGPPDTVAMLKGFRKQVLEWLERQKK